MPFFTHDIRTALNRAALYQSVGQEQRAIILRHTESNDFVVVDSNLLLKSHTSWLDDDYTVAIDLPMESLSQLTGTLQLSILEDDIYAISQENI